MSGKWSYGGRERIAFHSSARMTRTEIQNIRSKRSAKSPLEPPTEKQLLFLSVLEEQCKELKIPCEAEFEIARQTRKGASGTIKKVLAILRQRKEQSMYSTETRIVSREQKDRDLEKGNVFVGSTRAEKKPIAIDPTDYDENDVKARAERAIAQYDLKPLTREEYLKMSDAESERWHKAFRRMFPDVGARLLAEAIGVSETLVSAKFKKAGASRKQGERCNGKDDERFRAWFSAGKEEAEPNVEPIKKQADMPIAEEPCVEPLQMPTFVVGEQPKVGEVKFAGTLKGKAKDVLQTMVILGLSEKEIEVRLW